MRLFQNSKQSIHAGILCLLGCFLVSKIEAQINLVPNPGFEEYLLCPDGDGQMSRAIHWYNPTDNTDCYGDYFNSCSSFFGVPSGGLGVHYQPSHSGNAYIFLILYNKANDSNFREYAQIQLLDTLKPGACYYTEFFVNKGNPYRWGVNNIAAHFSTDTVWSTAPVGLLTLSPDIENIGNPIILDTVNWVRVSGIYTALGGEHYLTIGNFFSDANTDTAFGYEFGLPLAAYLIDDVSVIPIDSVSWLPFAGDDTSVTLGDSVYIGTLTNGLTDVHWFDSTGGEIADSIPGLFVTPLSSTYYTVQVVTCSKTFVDTVHVQVNPVGIDEINNGMNVQVYPNPAVDHISVDFGPDMKGQYAITLIDITGRTIVKEVTRRSMQMELNVENGLYWLRVTDGAMGAAFFKKILVQR